MDGSEEKVMATSFHCDRIFVLKPVGAVIALCLLFASITAQAIDIKPSLSGNWYNPAQSGHGFDVQVIDGDQTIIFWYVYDADGEPIWLFSQGPNVGNRVQATVYWHDGMRWGDLDNNDLNQEIWGTMTMEFHDCNNATITYSSDMSYKGQPFGSGTIEVKRLTGVSNNECTENDLGGNYVLAGVNPYSEAVLGYAIIFQNGVAMIAGARFDGYAAVTWGSFTENNGTFSFEGTEFGLEGFIGGVNISGEYLPGRINVPISSIGPLSAVEDRFMFMANIPTSTLAKTWSIREHDGSFVGNIRLHSNGAVSGSIIEGCSVSGTWRFPDPDFNQIWIEMALSDCTIAGDSYASAFYDIQNNELNIMGVVVDPVRDVGIGGYVVVGR